MSYALNAGAGAFILGTASTGFRSIIAAGALLILTLPLTVALVKNRMFQEARGAYARGIMAHLAENEADIGDIPTSTSDAAGVLAEEALRAEVAQRNSSRSLNRLLRRVEGSMRTLPAYDILLATLLASHAAQVVLIIFAVAGCV